MAHLLVLLATCSFERIFGEFRNGFVDMLSIYRWAAANKVCDGLNIFAWHLYESTSVPSRLTMQASRHTELLEEFSARQSGNMTGALATEGAEELNLILEVVDILDELNMLMLLLEKQASVASEACLFLGTDKGLMEFAVKWLQDKRAETARLHGEVTQTHKLVS